MPQLKSVPELTDLVYKPVSEMITKEALKVGHICVTQFHIDEEDGGLEDVTQTNENFQPSQNLENNHSSTMLTLDEHIQRREACLALFFHYVSYVYNLLYLRAVSG